LVGLIILSLFWFYGWLVSLFWLNRFTTWPFGSVSLIILSFFLFYGQYFLWLVCIAFLAQPLLYPAFWLGWLDNFIALLVLYLACIVFSLITILRSLLAWLV